MMNLWKSLSVTACLSALLLLGVAATPCTANQNNGAATAQTTEIAPATDGPATTAPATTASKPVPAKKQKSVLDADVLESPFSFFKDVNTGEEDDSDLSIKPSTLVLALKALAATLLSTIM